jgi:hypothetical protein
VTLLAELHDRGAAGADLHLFYDGELTEQRRCESAARARAEAAVFLNFFKAQGWNE